MRLSRFLVATASAVGLLASAQPTLAAAPIMSLADVQPGMACTVSSVIQGETPTTFDATVLGTYGGPAPADALIIMRFSGAAIASTGLGQGFSGSPVSCPDGGGTPRVIGAVSAGIGQYDNFVGGVTPIEAMLATPTWGTGASSTPLGEPETPAPTAARKATSTQPWGQGAETLQLSGPRGAAANRLADAANRGGLSVRVAPAATRKATTGGTLAPGDAVAAAITTGAVGLAAIGTVTYVDGDRVWAFGHPLVGTGASRLLMQRASILTVIASPSTFGQVSYKLGQPTSTVGTVGFDGTAAIGGVLGAAPGLIDTTATVRRASGDVLHRATTQIVDERAIRGAVTAGHLGLSTASNAALAVQRAARAEAVSGSTRTCTTIKLKGGLRPLGQCADSVTIAANQVDGGVELSTGFAAATSVGPVTSAHQFVRLVESVDVDITYREEADAAAIVRVAFPRRVRAGRTVTARVTLIENSTGDRRVVRVPVRIPSSAAGAPLGVVVTSEPVEWARYGTESDDTDGEMAFTLDDAKFGPAVPKDLNALRGRFTTAGRSGIRLALVPGVRARDARDVLETGASEALSLSRAELLALRRQVKIAREFPTLRLSGGASVTLRPTR